MCHGLSVNLLVMLSSGLCTCRIPNIGAGRRMREEEEYTDFGLVVCGGKGEEERCRVHVLLLLFVMGKVPG